MGKNHLSRLTVPNTWPVEKKQSKWITRPVPGPHPLAGCIPLSVLIRDMLGQARTMKEIKNILSNKSILIDKVVREEYRFPVGFMDVVEVPTLGEIYRIVFDTKGVFSAVPISEAQSNLKLLRVVNKTAVKKGMIQITFHDGRNILVSKFEGKRGDSVLFNLTKKSVDKILHLDKGALVYLNGGKHIGHLAKIKEVVISRNLQQPRVVIEIDGKEYVTLVKYAFVVGKDKLELDLGVKKQ